MSDLRTSSYTGIAGVGGLAGTSPSSANPYAPSPASTKSSLRTAKSVPASPLTPVLSNLRRKHAAAAGPQVGILGTAAVANATTVSDAFLMEFAVLPMAYAGDMDIEDMARRLSEEENSDNRVYKIRSASAHNTSPTATTEKRNSGTPILFGEGPKSQTQGAIMSSRYRSALASTSHAENLLCSTPHLRHLSAASADMQGGTPFSTSGNVLSRLFNISSGSLSPDAKKVGGDGVLLHNGIPDYGTCQARSRANREVALDLAAFVRILAHEMSLEDFAAVESEVFTSIFALVHSTDNNIRLAGVAALDALIGVPSLDEEKKAIKFASNLSNGLRANNVDYEFLSAVSKALGRMARGAANVDYVEFEVTRALEWLRTMRSDRRLAATLTLKELARNAPTAFYSKTNQTAVGYGGSNEFIDYIFPVLRDPQPIVRVCAADALSECLKFLVDRKQRSTTGLLCQVYSNVMDGFKTRKSKKSGSTIMAQAQVEAAQHASLLAIGDMLVQTKDFMLPRFDEVCRAVLGLTDHPKALLRLEVIRLIPRLAGRCPGTFGRRYLEDGLRFIMRSASSTPPPRAGVDVRPASFFALGQLVLAMSEGIRTEAGDLPMSSLQILTPSFSEQSKNATGDSAFSLRIEYHTKIGDIYSQLDCIFALVRSGLVKTRPSDASRGASIGADTRCEALHCGADLVEALGSHAEPYMTDLLNDMFESGLSEDLIHCLHAISICLPSKQALIEDRLLQELSLRLAGTKAAHAICDPLVKCDVRQISGQPKKNKQTRTDSNAGTGQPKSTSSVTNRRESAASGKSLGGGGIGGSDNYLIQVQGKAPQIKIDMLEREDVVMKLVLSLRTLGSFGSMKEGTDSYGSCRTLLPFISDVVAQYLSHPSSDVRREAALTCCQLLLPQGNNFCSSGHATVETLAARTSMLPPTLLRRPLGNASSKLVEGVFQKLLRVAVSDPSPLVRHSVVRAFDRRYDPYLCQVHHLPPLFLMLQDEALAVRAAALRLLGRLAQLNPAPILPDLRRILMELIIELRCGGDSGGGREAATRLLVVFLRAEALHRLVHPFLQSIIEALPLKGVAPRLASAALVALGELALVSRSFLSPWLNQLIPHILETMQDQSSASKQRTSLRTLGLIAGSTGYVISPYLDYPQLLPLAADVLPGTKRAPWALRREVIRTFGILGALDPDRYHAVATNSRKGGGVGGGYFIEMEDDQETGLVKRRGAVSSLDTGLTIGRNLTADGTAKEPTITTAASITGFTTAAAGAIANGATTQRNNGRRDSANEYLNALDSKHRISGEDHDEPAHLYMYEQYAMTAQPVSKLPPARRLSPSDEAFYPTVAVQALTRILKDPSLAVHHGMMMQAVMFIFNSLGLRCVPFLPRIVPHILYTVRTCGQASLRDALLQQIVILSGIVRDHLRSYVPAIFEVVEEFWSSKHLLTILILVEKMAIGVPDDFRKYVPRLVPRLLSSIEVIQETENVSSNSRRGGVISTSADLERLDLVLKSIRSLKGTLGEYMHLFVPALVELTDSLINPALNSGISSSIGPTKLAKMTVQTISVLLQAKDFGSSSSVSDRSSALDNSIRASNSLLPARAAQPLMRMLGNESNISTEVGATIVEALCVCAKQLGSGRWMPLYHEAARDAIIAWHLRVGLPVPLNGFIGHDTYNVAADRRQEAPNQVLIGIRLYDQVIFELHANVGFESALPSSISDEAVLPGRSSLSEAKTRRGSLTFDHITPTGACDVTLDPLDSETYNAQPSIQPIPNQTSKHRVNQANLQRAWDVSQRTTREDWDEWMRRFAVQLLREAPAPALRATAALAHAYQPLARELFSAAFVCCWSDLSDQYRSNLVRSLEIAFAADVSPEILQTLLNLAEFMEHDGTEGGLPINIAVLAELALKCRSYAKALHYKERETNLGCGGACIEDLILINMKLDFPEAALGVLQAARAELELHDAPSWGHSRYSLGNAMQSSLSSSFFHRRQGLGMAYSVISSEDEISARGGGLWAGAEMQESWLATLGSWSDALAMYERKLKENSKDVEAILGCMRCLVARGEWRGVIDLAKLSWVNLSGESRFSNVASDLSSRDHRKAVKFCAQAAWRLGQWDDLETYASKLVRGRHDQQSIGRDNGPSQVDYDGAFYSAVLHVHRKEWSLAADSIDAARRAMDSRFTALMAESYKRAYPSMVTAQTLAEMEEIIAFRKLEDDAKSGSHRHPANRYDEVEARRRLLMVWRKRLAGCRVDAEVHSSILAVRSLVQGPADEVESTLTLSALSRQAQCPKLAERVLLDPLTKLGADLKGTAFGFGLPPSLGLGLSLSREFLGDSGNTAGVIDRLVTGDACTFSPKYGPAHEQYSHRLAREAGGVEKLNIQHCLYYAYVKHLWAMDGRKEAMSRLARLSDVVDMVCSCEHSQKNDLRVSCWLKLGEWKLAESQPPTNNIPESLQTEVLVAYKRATAAVGSGYKAWHAWALFNFRLAQQCHDVTISRADINLGTGRSRISNASSKTLRNHVVAAVRGFVKAISLGTKRWSASVQQDMLNFLTCLFKYRELPEVATTINDEIGAVTIEAWLGVLPQLLARIHIKSLSVRSVLHPLLIRLGAKHPQALMYPLSVLLKSPVIERKIAAESLMHSLKAHSNDLVEEALMVSSELIRIAILWLELWHEGLEDASRLYFGEGNVSGMLDVLIPLHDQLDKGPSTKTEHDFYVSFGRDLAEAHTYVKEYMRLTTSNGGVIPTQGGFLPGASTQREAGEISSVRQNAEAEAALNQAWDLYYTVFRRINKQLPGLTSLELSQCSPALLQAHNLELGVPGSYRVDGSYVKIERFVPSVQVITSKQRPRKVVLRGSDGNDYVFLLKGHEDLRQDERVMQLFGLVNALLARDRRTNKHDLNIQRYAIAPLSHNAGVVGWVPHCDTFHSLIRDYRESKKVPLNMENREMMKLALDYDLLTTMQKIEVFSEALERTTGKGNDLYEVMWIKSTNSEEWLERRTKFTRSLAVMSMVGYILGLGDRHPSNLMLDQISGRVLHIDFGDCFEIAMHREKFPEKIPFRLTRMLIKAMEVSGIEGSYRSTCERTMSVLRDNRDSLVAMLEAFVYDPLISWRLLGQSSNEMAIDGHLIANPDDIMATTNQDEFGRPLTQNSKSNVRSEGHNRQDGVSHAMLHDSIRENPDEDDEDDETVSDRGSLSSIDPGGPSNQVFSLKEQIRRASEIASARKKAEEDTAQSSHTKSLLIYSNMQAMAASLSSSSLIASVTGGGAERLAAEGSLARSRLDRSARQRELLSLLEGEEGAANEEALNGKALKVIRRVQDKLTGTDFAIPGEESSPLDVQDQVQRLIIQATSTENLCQLFIGWCAFW